MPDVMLTIEGMHCGTCVKNVTRALQKMEGVEIRRVDIGTAVVTIDPARTDAGTIAAAISDAGYPAHSA